MSETDSTFATDRASAVAVIEDWLGSAGVEWELGARDGEFVITLPGERKLKTVTSVLVSDRHVSVSAFVVRNPDENHEGVYRLLLQRNLRLPGLTYAIDGSGDVYLTGQVPVRGLSVDSFDELMGAVLEASDGIFNDVLAKGFLTSMKKEWRWRVTHGESTRNLEAFKHLLDDSNDK